MSTVTEQLRESVLFERFRRPLAGIVALVVLVLLPLTGGSETPFFVTILVEIFVFAIFAMGFNILTGYTGYVSFGHVLFLGSGAYGTVLLVSKAQMPFLVAGLLSLVGTAVLAFFVALVAFRRKGVYFAMITLGAAQIIYTLFRTLNYVGGTTGLIIQPPTVFGYEFNPFSPMSYYYVYLAILVLVYLLVRTLVRSPFGHAMQAIRENEERAEAIGYNVQRLKYASFTIAGALSGFAGVLYAAYFSQVAPGSTLYWTVTGNGLFMLLIGGLGTVIGPIIGAFFVIGSRYLLSTYLGSLIPAEAPVYLQRLPERWLLILGLVFIITVLRFPHGIASKLGFKRTREETDLAVREDGPSGDKALADGGDCDE
jgi:branched-chain amino acid transport system permease protein